MIASIEAKRQSRIADHLPNSALIFFAAKIEGMIRISDLGGVDPGEENGRTFTVWWLLNYEAQKFLWPEIL
jgi:hypothetical protein